MRTALTLLLFVMACDHAPAPATQLVAAPPAASESAIELRSYVVPQGLAGELANVVNSQLYRSQEQAPIGRAQVGPGGQLVVTAPPGVLTGVEALIARLAEAPPEAPPVVELTYWAVTAVPTVAPLDAATEPAARPAELQEVAQALDAVAAAEGPRTFALIEKLRVQQVSGSDAAVGGRELRVQQSASARQGEVIADVSLHRNSGGELRTQVLLPLGKLLVLGQAGAVSKDGKVHESVYFIVRAAVVGKTGG
jgi:hypothetical protein